MNRRNFLLGAVGFAAAFFTDFKILEGSDFKVPEINLNSGYKIPQLGIGTWTLGDNQAENIVYRLTRYYGSSAVAFK